MRQMLKFISVLLSAGMLLTACAPKSEEPEPEPPGSFKDSTNYDAPKVIASTEIVTFRCEFSAMDIIDVESELLGNAYTLTAGWKDGVVTGGYELRTRYYEKESHSFQAGREFMDQLQALVAKHDLAQYNGLSYHVYGLSEDCGAELSITYASGETIYAGNNQSCFLPLEAMEDLARLFRQQNIY